MQKFKKGDKVKFLNDVGTGIITSVKDDQTVMVESDMGFEIPYPMKELLITEKEEETIDDIAEADVEEEIPMHEDSTEVPFRNPETNAPPAGNTKKSQDPEQDEQEPTDIQLLFALVPKEDDIKSDQLDAYLINDSNYHVLFSIGLFEKEHTQPVLNGSLNPDTKIYIDQLTREYLSKHADWSFQFILYRNTNYRFLNPVVCKVNLQPLTLFEGKSYQKNDYFDQKALIYSLHSQTFQDYLDLLSGDDIQKVIKEKEVQNKVVDTPSKKQEKTKNTREIDLHIHELVEDETSLSDGDKLDLQLHHFKKGLENALEDNESKIVFIHGKGTGRLRHEIRRILERDYPQYSYQDASFQEYGFGATLVLLK